MNKHLAAFVAATAMSACSATAILAVGGVAFFNRSGVAPSTTSAPSSKAADATLVAQSHVQELEEQLSQYQARDQQYQRRERRLQRALGKAEAQIQADEQEIQQYRLLLLDLQEQGLIAVTDAGQILINRASEDE